VLTKIQNNYFFKQQAMDDSSVEISKEDILRHIFGEIGELIEGRKMVVFSP
jgi:hypothetical protein